MTHNPSDQPPTSVYPFPLDELLQRPCSPLQWTISGLLPEGVILLAGKPQSGRSLLVLQFALSVATGEPALGKFPTVPGEVLYISLDDFERRIFDRSHNLLQGRPAPHNLAWTHNWLPFNANGVPQLERWLQQHTTPRLIIIDPLSRFHLNVGAHSYLHDHAVVSCLKRLADTYHISILLVHHLRRSSSQDPFDGISCSLGLLAPAAVTIILRRERGKKHGSLILSGPDMAINNLPLTFDEDTISWTTPPLATPRYSSLTPEREEILKVLHQANQPLSPSEIATSLDKEPTRISRMLYTMVRAGLICTAEKSKYIPLVGPLEMLSGGFFQRDNKTPKTL